MLGSAVLGLDKVEQVKLCMQCIKVLHYGKSVRGKGIRAGNKPTRGLCVHPHHLAEMRISFVEWHYDGEQSPRSEIPSQGQY